MKCLNHPEKDAVAVCVACGSGLCPDCRKVVRGAAYCEDCEAARAPMRIYPGREGHGVNVWAVLAWMLAVVGWWPGLEFVAIAAVILGFVSLYDIRVRSYSQTGRSYALAAIGCAGILLVVKIGFFFYYLAHGLEMSPWLNPFRYVS